MKEIYTDQDVLKYWKDNYVILKTRKRNYIDPRNYFIGLLYCKFEYIEEELADIFKIDRSSINYAKRAAHNFIEHEDAHFIKNTKVIRQKFPYTFPKVEDISQTRLYSIVPRLDRRTIKKLKKYANEKSRRTNQVAGDIIIEYLDKWVK